MIPFKQFIYTNATGLPKYVCRKCPWLNPYSKTGQNFQNHGRVGNAINLKDRQEPMAELKEPTTVLSYTERFFNHGQATFLDCTELSS